MTGTSTSGRGFRKVMRGLDMTLFTVCAILVIDQLAASAAIGPQAIFWWIFTMILFFIPYGLITAELGTTYPEQGGIYAWITRAYGRRWGGRTAWLWWINVALWMPSVYILFAGIFAQLFWPDLGLWGQVLICLLLTWITVGVNIIALDVGKWVPNAGAIFKAVIMVVIGVGGFYYAFNHGVANEITLSTIMPTWDVSLAFLPVVVYNFMGFELMSGASEEMKDPKRDVPRAIILSGVLIAAFYLLGTVGILIALPLDDIGLVEGLIDTLQKLFGDSGAGGAFVVALGVMALYTFFANMVTWTMGANRSAAEASERGDLPSLFAKLHKTYKTPVSSAIVTGLVSSGVLILYAFMAADAEDLFWTLFAFSALIFLLPYPLMFMAFLKLRRMDPDIERPYRVPGGHGRAVLVTVLCMLFMVQAIVLFIFPPGEMDWGYTGFILVGLAVTLAVGEWLVAGAQRRHGRSGA
ncbi:MAG: APC family permease [Alphaproteobacteria bacterium]